MGSLLAIPAAVTAVITGFANEGLLHWIYYIITYIYLYVVRFFHRRRLNLYDYKVDGQPEKTGLFVPHEEYALDYPQEKVKLRKVSDDVFFYGINSNSESLAVHVARIPNGYVCSSLLIRLADGKLYTLPEEHKIQKEINGEPGTFGSARFKVQCLSPFRKWRIFFNGILREVSEEENEIVPRFKHITFTFLWTASSEVFDYNDNISTKVLAKAAASPSSLFSFPVLTLKKMRNYLDSYEQPGMILGTLKCGGEEKEMYLWGVRGRYRGSKNTVADSKILQIYGTFKNGAVIHLESRYIPGVSPKFTFGYVMKSDGFIHPIQANKERITEKMMRFSFDCDGEKYLFDVPRKPLFKKKFEKEFCGNIEVEQDLMVLNGMDGRGLVFSGTVKEPQIKIKQHKAKTLFAEKCDHPQETSPLSVSFQDLCCQNPDLTGGKGSSLGKLHALSKDTSIMKSSYDVPLGVVVTTEAYKEFIKSDLMHCMKKFEKSVWSDKHADVSTLCIALSDKVSKTSIPEKIISSVVKNLELVFGPNWTEMKFAVRSSATGEDTSQMSAAGQMETYLALKGKEQIFDAVRKCWASQFFVHPVQYKRRYGQPLNMPMAVVIQRMVDCNVAGVLFTCDPVTGNPEFLSISANYGLGESVVSASADPDTIVIRRDVYNRLSYHSEVIGQKKSKIVMDDYAGTKEMTFDIPADACCLKKDAALKLAEIAIQVEEEFGDPRDIEWGIVDDKIFLFQSRPVTSIDTDTEFEAKHFFDSHLRAEEEYATTANVGEVLPGCISPLCIDWGENVSNISDNRQPGVGWCKNSGPNVPYFHKAVSYAYNHCFLSLVNGFLGFDDSISGKAMMISIFGRIIEERQKITKMATERHGNKKPPSLISSFLENLYMIMVMFGSSFWIRRGNKNLKRQIIHYKNKKTAAGVLNAIAENCGKFWVEFYSHFLSTTASSNWNMMILTLLAKAKGALDNVVYSDFAYLLSTCTQLESADIPAAIQNLGFSIAKCIDPKKFQTMSIEDAIKWLQNTDTEAGVKYQNFLERHGTRCPKEYDIYTLPWKWDQRSLIQTLQVGMSGNINLAADEKKSLPFSEVLSNLHVKLDFTSRLKLRLLLPNSRRAVREREASKALTVKATHEYRKPFYRLAELLVEEGRLPQKDLAFFLSFEEIRQLIKTRSPRIVARAQKRFSYISEMEQLMFPEIVCGVPRPTNIYEDYDEAVEGTTMTGFPVSQGVVKAPACVVPTLADAHNIKPGDVLITYSTDIGWSPYFPLLSGVVTELGGLVSHGAVVAREYGLPCVVGLQGATKVFKSGDIVVLDGTKGTIKKIK